jgi:hypothetical protein
LFLALALATQAQTNAATMKVAMYFGGYKSTQSEINLWTQSAEAQLGTSYKLMTYPYPTGASSGASSAIANFGQSNIDNLAEEIVSNPSISYTVVGHSSGCAIADAVAERVTTLQSGKIPNLKLIVLDGFLPSAVVMNAVNYKCYSAYDRSTTSLNWSAMQNCGANFVSLQAPNCGREVWCLHFSLVNSAATASTVQTIPEGYNNCKANLAWLN